MHVIWSRLLRSTYRREPVVSFIVTAGVVEAAIGGLDEHWLLMGFGLSTIGAAIALRWWQQRQAVVKAGQTLLYALSHRPSQPELSFSKRRSTNDKR
ncbi:hypothetical protein [Stenomitos frigidus]|uniref:Uncharacterized protein n=1 Tax=Stenomitos frigidus ULC18 TaxID=2107698 RepID=A0A2T1E1E0_9CYAN|nr:hypothetical protein [Stenomitos frigidus]PSB26583.1 hypothetical protein C7B82_19385 [Stenomitos frigidus ULC18]